MPQFVKDEFDAFLECVSGAASWRTAFLRLHCGDCGHDKLVAFSCKRFRTTFLVAVPKDSAFKSLGDIVAAAKAAPGKVTYGSWDLGSPGHLGATLLELQTGIAMQSAVPRGQPAVHVGRCRRPAVQLGRLQGRQAALHRGRLVASNKRLPQVPEVPTAAEAGGPADFDVNAFVVLVAPKGLPAAVHAKVNADVAKVLTDPEVKARFDTFASDPVSWSPDEIARQADAKSKVYEQLVKKANISLD